MISTVDQVYAIMLLVAPGFFGYYALRFFSIEERKPSNYEILVWSIALSIFTHSIIFQFSGIESYESMITKIYDPYFLNTLLWTPLIIGSVAGWLIKTISKDNIYPKDCWWLFQHKLADTGSWVIVYTQDKKEYMGLLNYAGRTEADKELVISNPVLIIRDDDLNVINEMELGSELLFTQDDISRIVFYEHF